MSKTVPLGAHRRALLLTAIALSLPHALPAIEPGTLDARFSDDGVLVTAVDTGGDLADLVRGISVDSDTGSGLALVLSSIARGSDQSGFEVRALTRNGDLFPAFGTGGIVDWFEPVGAAPDRHRPAAIGRAADGSFFVLAGVEWADSDLDFVLFKYDDLGQPDTAFGSGFSTPGERWVPFDLGGDLRDDPMALVVDSLGLTVAGSVATGAVNSDFGFARLDVDSGDLDATFDGDGKRIVAFDSGGSHRDFLCGLARQVGGKIVAAGMVETAADVYHLGLVRLDTAGVPDPTFGNGGQVVVPLAHGLYPAALLCPTAVDADGRILVAVPELVGASTVGAVLRRFDADGELDPSFGGGGSVVISEADYAFAPTGLVVEGDGALLWSVMVLDLTAGTRSVLVQERTSGGLPSPGWVAWDAWTFVAGHDAVPFGLALGWQEEIWVGGGSLEPTAPNTDLGVARLVPRRVFADGFESGNVHGWSTIE